MAENEHDSAQPDRRGVIAGTMSAVAGLAGVASSARADAPKGPGASPRLFTFVGGTAGEWTVQSIKALAGDTLPEVPRIDFISGTVATPPGEAKWVLRGVTSNGRYTTRDENDRLVKKQAALGRKGATHAALIPIRKSAKWWTLTQDERRAIFEERSKHITVGLKYLPAVARRLHHCRDLGEAEPFDFLTLFDYAKADASAFDDMLAELRATEEWKFVDREVDIRLLRKS
jgi:hypothetical protein